MKRIKKNLQIARGLLTLMGSLKLKMSMAILLGSLGHIFASMIPTMGAYGLASLAGNRIFSFWGLGFAIILLALLRAFLRYKEQLLNHEVAFTILAVLRDGVFQKLRQLSPAKMEEKDSGEMIALVTSDIELLEVFYAHTISPVAIAFFHTLVLMGILAYFSYKYALLILFFHLLMALAVPLITAKRSQELGKEQRGNISALNSHILDTFRGIDQCIQYNCGEQRREEMEEKTQDLVNSSKKLSKIEGENRALGNSIILLANASMLVVSSHLYITGGVSFLGYLAPIVLFMSSFGPVSALSSLANNLILTLACGERVLGLLEEKPPIKEIKTGEEVVFQNLSLDQVSFSYDGQAKLLDKVNLSLQKGEILGIKGKSGCGKSTLLKLIMRFYEPDSGKICINGKDINGINSKNLWENISYVTQSTHIFHDTIRNNIKMAKLHASEEEIVLACKKASIHDFIHALPQGYDTIIDGKEVDLSTGEKQRISIARAFLQNGSLLLLDEPTANIDAINEGMILKSLWEESKDKALILLSHRDSTLRIAHKIINLD